MHLGFWDFWGPPGSPREDARAIRRASCNAKEEGATTVKPVVPTPEGLVKLIELLGNEHPTVQEYTRLLPKAKADPGE